VKPPARELTISLVMAVLDGDRFLGQALDSVAAQTRQPDEIIIVDGGSSDRSVAIAESYERVRVIKQQRGDGGFAGAWDEGIAEATSNTIALLDSDDLWTPDKLARQAAMLEASPELDYVVGMVRHFLEPGYPLPAAFRPEILEVDRLALMPGAVLVRRTALELVGPWATDFTIAADIDWFARAKDQLGAPGIVDARVISKRVHDTNVSLFRAQKLNAEILALLRASVARRR
jgi:glycosyltransferase involved in cell wall biosynthesis